MINALKKCFICESNKFNQHTKEYLRCINCGHEIFYGQETQNFIINEYLSSETVNKKNKLDIFKSRILSRFDRNIVRNTLFDIGSGSGRFLHQNRSRYKNTVGMEITSEAIKFSQKVLNLKIIESIDDAPKKIDVVTAWQSLEHIPTKILLKILNQLSLKINDQGLFIISVPNSGSFQYQWFKSDYAFFDTPNHLHQFTLQSLVKLMSRFEFEQLETVFSAPYNFFGYTQSIMNFFIKPHNYLYYRLKRRSQIGVLRLDIYCLLLLPFASFLGIFFSLFDLIYKKKQGVLTICFQKIAR